MCVDINEEKVKSLSAGKITIYEPGLEVIFHRNIEKKRLEFTTDLAKAVDFGDIIFLADEKGVIFIEGYGVSESVKVDKNTTNILVINILEGNV